MHLSLNPNIKILLNLEIPSNHVNILYRFYFSPLLEVPHNKNVTVSSLAGEGNEIRLAYFSKNPNYIGDITKDAFIRFIGTIPRQTEAFVFLFQFGWMNEYITHENANIIIVGFIPPKQKEK